MNKQSSFDIKNIVWKGIKIVFYVFIFIFFITLTINVIMVAQTRKYIYKDISAIPQKQIVLILGARVYTNALSFVLEDRVKAGIEILQEKKADKILLSGDHGRKNYDEVNAMRKYLLNNAFWIAQENIFMDHAGFNTYDNMYRAKAVFQVDSVIIVTQDFHIIRSVYIARKLGLNAIGFSVNQKKYKREFQTQWGIREYFARVKAFVDTTIHRNPRYLGEIISIHEDGRKSWD